MSLEQSFRRLAIQPRSVCHQCRRAIASSTRSHQQQSATAAFHDVIQSGRDQNSSQRFSQRTATATPPRASSDPFSATAPSPQSSPPVPAGRSSSTAFDLARSMVRESSAARTKVQEDERLRDALRNFGRKDLEQQMVRKWKPGDVYAPHDLSGTEASKWKRLRRKPRPRHGDKDVVDSLGIKPLEHYKNFSVMSEYVTEMGRIRHSNDTGLKPVNQRRMAKAIRRAIGVGLIPSVYRHPELLREEIELRNARSR